MRGTRILVTLGLVASLALLLAHASVYSFLTDDAHISFRYAKNLAEGHGLVFNPGFERVEGYTNFLWVLLLALAHAAGAPLPGASYALSTAATIGLWAVLVGLSFRIVPPERRGFVLLPVLLLAATRSVAVWSTGGLETRLFELLIAGGVLRLLVEDGRLLCSARPVHPLAALLLALATWTRPDGLLISGSLAAALALVRRKHLGQRSGWIASSTLLYGLVVGSHLLARKLYYGEWVPNTYHAKVGGHLWWSMGLRYFATFAIEYAVWLWVPFLAAGVFWLVRRGTPIVPALCAAVVLPHALYVASVGGDHFEFRPLDLYFPFAFLLIAAGAMAWARTRGSTCLVLAALAALLLAGGELPYRSHVQFPDVYSSGFPGTIAIYGPENFSQALVAEDARRFLDPDRSLVYRLPGLRALARAHQELVREATDHFVGIRQEEHRLFLGTVAEEGRRLAGLVAEGRLPPDTYVALDCVGAIPFHSGLRTLDRLGLTDAQVAHQEFLRPDVMAHGKYARSGYALERGVDLWAFHTVHLLWDVEEPKFLEMFLSGHYGGVAAYFARIDDRTLLGAMLPRGPDAARVRFPALQFESILDGEVAERLARRAMPAYRAAMKAHPGIAEAHSTLGLALILTGEEPEAEAELRAALVIDPLNETANNNLARLLVDRGDLRGALPLLERAVARRPEDPRYQTNLAKVLRRLGETERALRAFERARSEREAGGGAD